jgi:hypothetical protein
MRSGIDLRLLACGLTLLGLAACSSGPLGSGGGPPSYSAVGPSGDAGAMGGDGRTSLDTQMACRQRVNEMYDRRNRAEIYAANPSVNTPQSANYASGISSRGLSNQFGYEQTIAECERNAGTATGPIAAPVAVPAAPPRKGR